LLQSLVAFASVGGEGGGTRAGRVGARRGRVKMSKDKEEEDEADGVNNTNDDK